jgi:hypothetical protein
MSDLIQRLERATKSEFHEDYSAQDYLNLCHEALAALKSAAADEADAKRMRWMLAGNGYFMEEEMLCGHGPCSEKEQDEARRQIDAAMLDRG